MKDTRTIISENLQQLRKEKKLTQLELAEKFNYSDKAVSKWENGDTLPDIETLLQLCEFYGVTLDYLVHEGDKKDKEKFVVNQTEKSNNIAISSLIVCAFWILVTSIFVYSTIALKNGDKYFAYWPVFVLGVPLSCLSFAITNRIYFKSRTINFITMTLFVWGTLATAYTMAAFANTSNYGVLWPIFLMGVPLEAALTIWFIMRKKK